MPIGVYVRGLQVLMLLINKNFIRSDYCYSEVHTFFLVVYEEPRSRHPNSVVCCGYFAIYDNNIVAINTRSDHGVALYPTENRLEWC